jgi:hypothetical protein
MAAPVGAGAMSASHALPDASRTKLAKLLGMLGSDHVGERDNAARAAHKLVTEARLTWMDVVQPAPTEHRPPQPSAQPWRQTVRDLLATPGSLRAWERNEFLPSILGFSKLSQKQRNILNEIAARVLGRGA